MVLPPRTSTADVADFVVSLVARNKALTSSEKTTRFERFKMRRFEPKQKIAFGPSLSIALD